MVWASRVQTIHESIFPLFFLHTPPSRIRIFFIYIYNVTYFRMESDVTFILCGFLFRFQIQIFGLTSIFSLNGKNRMKEGGKKSGYKRKVPVGFIPKEQEKQDIATKIGKLIHETLIWYYSLHPFTQQKMLLKAVHFTCLFIQSVSPIKHPTLSTPNCIFHLFSPCTFQFHTNFTFLFLMLRLKLQKKIVHLEKKSYWKISFLFFADCNNLL